MQYLFYIMGSFLITLGLVPLIKKMAFKVGAVDNPCQRKVHCKPMPRLGGLAIYIGFIAMVLLTQPLTQQIIGLVLGSTIIAMIGVVDDIKDLSPKLKLLGQIIAACVLVAFNIDVDYITHPFANGVVSLGYLSIPVTVLWVVGITNAVNLIDGLDGLAAGLSAIAAITLAIVGYSQGHMLMVVLSLMLAASTLGFLRYNFYPAQIFMGDSGSMFLGFNLSALAIMGFAKSITVISVFVPILILGIPIFDTMFAIIRRYFNGQPIFKADKEHLHHCLLNKGFTHKQTVLLIYAINILLAGTGVLLTHITTAQSILILAVISTMVLWSAQKIGVIGKPLSKRITQQTVGK
ncbi:MAG: UDP-phosphate N-acetylglucosaminyl 1-phosphate transferase [Peptococcaceae bacterium BICA1-8]|nr:MAG: UDP-phosphate N-acetylglucosaminyl 1-phosphate transferase [Peptococcaceae bacterium BICA1-8]